MEELTLLTQSPKPVPYYAMNAKIHSVLKVIQKDPWKPLENLKIRKRKISG